jgi:hypothetical protein
LPRIGLVAGLLLIAGLLAWVAVALARLSRSVTKVAESLVVLTRSVSAMAERNQEDSVLGPSRQVAFTVTGQYPGDPARGLPGAVVVKAQNAGTGFLYDLTARYTPSDGPEKSQGLALLPPGSSIEFSFELFDIFAFDWQFSLSYTDGRDGQWTRTAGSPQARRRATKKEKGA